MYIYFYISNFSIRGIDVFCVAEEKAKLKKLQLEQKKKNAEFRAKVQVPLILFLIYHWADSDKTTIQNTALLISEYIVMREQTGLESLQLGFVTNHAEHLLSNN